MKKRSQGPTLWLIAGLAVPILYVASSGPAFSLASRAATPFEISCASPASAPLIRVSKWWERVYAPLRWIPPESWVGERLSLYWCLFAPNVVDTIAGEFPL